MLNRHSRRAPVKQAPRSGTEASAALCRGDVRRASAGLLLVALFLAFAAHAEERELDKLSGDQVELSRSVSRALFSVQRHERALARSPEALALLDEVRELTRELPASQTLPSRGGRHSKRGAGVRGAPALEGSIGSTSGRSAVLRDRALADRVERLKQARRDLQARVDAEAGANGGSRGLEEAFLVEALRRAGKLEARVEAALQAPSQQREAALRQIRRPEAPSARVEREEGASPPLIPTLTTGFSYEVPDFVRESRRAAGGQ